MRTLLFSLFMAAATATYDDCGSRYHIRSYTVDPPGVVGAGQNVTTDLVFDVPQTLERGRVGIYTTWNHLMATEVVAPMCDYFDCPLTNGTRTWRYRAPFPTDVSGRIQTTVRLLSVVGDSLLCLRWTAYATGTASNETSWIVRKLYA
jgi:hypothetical protein